jgi:hypothetical protein
MGMVESMDRLTRPSRLGVKEGLHQNLALVDLHGNRLQIVGAKKVRTIFSFRFGALLALIGGNPIWQMDLTLNSMDERFAAFKELACFSGHRFTRVPAEVERGFVSCVKSASQPRRWTSFSSAFRSQQPATFLSFARYCGGGAAELPK